jgi:hypothetical protein
LLKAQGTYRPDRRPLPVTGTVTSLPGAPGVPEAPASLGLNGRALWERAWNSAITWLSPDSDWDAVVLACSLADDLALAREVYRASRDAAHGRVVVSLSREMSNALSVLGFDPSSRSRLGVAEVKAMSALDKLAAARAKR